MLNSAIKAASFSSPGQDNITNEMLKHLTIDFKNTFLFTYNQLWREGMYPTKWKEAIIVPIPKAGKNPLLASSYRPTSLALSRKTVRTNRQQQISLVPRKQKSY